MPMAKKITVLFLQKVEGIAEKNALKSVSAGFFRHFLSPKKLAKVATLHEIAKSKEVGITPPPSLPKNPRPKEKRVLRKKAKAAVEKKKSATLQAKAKG